MKKLVNLLGTIGFMSIAGGAAAVQYTWDFASTPLTGSYTAACGTIATATCEVSKTVTGGGQMFARAYSTTGASNSLNDKLIGAKIYQYSGGLGVVNLADESPAECDASTTTNCSPEHALDNMDRYDVMVFEAPEANFDWASMGIGWYNPDSDVTAWVGNGTGESMNFTSMCLSAVGTGCSDTTNIRDTASGFKSLGNFFNEGTGSVNLDKNVSTSKGRYLVVSGALDPYAGNDAFKINSIKGAPEPQTLVLLGVGLLGLVSLSRRRAVVA